MKDVEPDKETSSSPLAITAGDEVLALEGNPSKSEDGLEGKVVAEDVEKGESSDDQDSNLALRFEGRKASYLLVQQVCDGLSAVSELDFAEISVSARVTVLTASNEVARIVCRLRISEYILNLMAVNISEK